MLVLKLVKGAFLISWRISMSQTIVGLGRSISYTDETTSNTLQQKYTKIDEFSLTMSATLVRSIALSYGYWCDGFQLTMHAI